MINILYHPLNNHEDNHHIYLKKCIFADSFIYECYQLNYSLITK